MGKKFESLKEEILGKTYSLSIAPVSAKKSQELNYRYRRKNKPTNVLSFPLSEESGEIILCPDIIRKQTKEFEKKFDDLFAFLVIHGMLHLKGYEHGDRMEKAEKKYDQKYLGRH